jgi:hypothetical protein
LAKLTGLECLQEVEICNRNVAWGRKRLITLYPAGPSDANPRSGIIFEAFGPKYCPNLQRLFVHQYANDVLGLLCAIAEDEAVSRKLAVCLGGLDAEPSSDAAFLFRPNPKHPGLPMRLRMVGFEMSRKEMEELEDLDSKGSRMDSFFDHLASSNADSLQGLAVCVPEGPSTKSVLKFLDFSEFESAVPRLPRLRQLALNAFFVRQFGPPVGKETLLPVAQRLAAVGRELRYISMFTQFWRVNRHRDGRVELHELDERERNTVELFDLIWWNPYRYERVNYGSWASLD